MHYSPTKAIHLICCYRQISKTTKKGKIGKAVKKILNKKKKKRKYPPILEECRRKYGDY